MSGTKKRAASLLCALALVMNIAAVAAEAEEGGTVAASKVVLSGTSYERDEVLEVNGEPFFYNGIQIRIDKVVDAYNFDAQKVKTLFQIAKDDGYTVANVQIRWMDVQPDKCIKAQGVTAPSGRRAFTFDIADANVAEGAKIRFKTTAAQSQAHYFSLYSGGVKIAQSPAWDAVWGSNYYDFDLTDYIKEIQEFNETTLTIELDSDGVEVENEAQLWLSSMEEYDWAYLDRIIGYAEEVGIKLEILWFATDTCSAAIDIRLPHYVYSNYQKCVYSDGTPWLKKTTGYTGTYFYLMCKNDMALRAQEYKVLKNVFDHIGSFNAKSGKYTVIGCQVCNEPNVARLHGGSVSENGTKLQNCRCATCVKMKAAGSYSDQGFRDYTMFEYCNNLSKAVKDSAYPVWTRVNNVQGNDAWGVTYNEAKRSSGGTDSENGTYLDFIGLDPYGWSRAQLYGFGTGSYAAGHNLPVVMESGGEKSMSALMMLATVAGGAFYNVYDLCSPDGHHMYDQNLNPRVIAAGDKYLPDGGTYIEDVRNHNRLLNKIAYPLATMKPDKLGGKDLLFFNCEGTENANINVTKRIGGMDVTYKSDTIFSSAIAVHKSNTEVVLLSTKDTDATFTLGDIASDVKSISYGHYEGSEWVSETGEVVSTSSGGSLVVTMPAFSCVRVETQSALPAPLIYEAENLYDSGNMTVSGSLKIEKEAASDAHGGYWTFVRNATVGTTVSFSLDVPANMDTARIATGYKSKSGRGSVQLAVNGVNYGGALSMVGDEKFTVSDYGPTVKLKAGEKNTFTYSVTVGGIVAFDYIELLKAESMPPTLSGSVLINEDFTNVSDNFGFSKGASVANGMLNITQSMANYTTAVKSFDANIINQSAIDLSFDWKTNITSSGKKSGIEFRDIYGRLIFAIESKSGSEFRHSVTGRDSDSAHSQYDWEPIWTPTTMDRNKTYTVRLLADFANKTVSYSVTEKGTGNVIAQNVNLPIEAQGLGKMIAANYYTNESGTSYVGTQNIDNFTLIGADGETDLPCSGKTIYAFGDSIVDGHKYQSMGFVEFTALKMGMKVIHSGAVNGATVTNGGIKGQLTAAPTAAPDVVIFDGGINDTYDTTDKALFSAAFGELIDSMKTKWATAKIVYVATHKTAAREGALQEEFHAIETAICAQKGVTVADVYSGGALDTTNSDMRWNYSFNDLGFDSLPGTMATTSSEKFSDTYPSGTHPNFLAIERFYVPCAEAALLSAAGGFHAEAHLSDGEVVLSAYGVSGEFCAAFFDAADRMICAKIFTDSATVPYESTMLYVKVFAWDTLKTMRPMANFQTIVLS